MLKKKILLLTAAILSCAVYSAEMRLIQNGMVLDRLPNGLFGSPNNPGGIAKTANGEWVTVIRTGGDHVQDSTLLYGSKDQGKNWYHIRTFITKDPTQAITYYLYQLPDNRQLFIEMVIQHTRRPKNYTDMVKNNLRKYMILRAYISTDGGRTMNLTQELVGENTYGGAVPSGELITLINGDILMPAYCSAPQKSGLSSGVGFFRSTDQGKTWQKFERAIFPAAGDEKVRFNEITFSMNNNGTLFAWVRTDTANQYIEPMYKAVSHDNGKTWSKAEKTSILGIYPYTIKLQNGLWVLMAGVRNDRYRDRVIQFYTSTDGENWEFVGRPYHFKPEDKDGLTEPKWGQTGGAQAMMEVAPGKVYVIFSAGDLHVGDSRLAPTLFKYVDGNLLEFIP